MVLFQRTSVANHPQILRALCVVRETFTRACQDPLPPLHNNHHQQHHHQQVISPSATTSMEMATGLRPPEPRTRGGQVQVSVII